MTTHAQQLVSIETFNRDINEQMKDAADADLLIYIQSTSDNSNLQRK